MRTDPDGAGNSYVKIFTLFPVPEPSRSMHGTDARGVSLTLVAALRDALAPVSPQTRLPSMRRARGDRPLPLSATA